MLHAAVDASLPATAVTHAVAGRFSPTLPDDDVASELVVVRGNRLTLYHVASATVQTVSDDVLRYVTDVQLNSTPLGVALCRPPNTTVDALVLLFDDFHVSVVQFNALLRRFDTVALIQLDDRECALERCTLPPLLRVDATGCHIGVLVKRAWLFIFPLLACVTRAEAAAMSDATGQAGPHGVSVASQPSLPVAAAVAGTESAVKPTTVSLDAWGDEDDEVDPAADAPRDGHGPATGAPDTQPDTSQAAVQTASGACDAAAEEDGAATVILVGRVTRVRLRDVKDTLRNVRDFCFVESRGEPLLAFLHEPYPTWAGRVKLLEWRSKTVESHQLTCAVMWVQVTMAHSTSPRLLVIGEVDSIPFNVTHMTAVPPYRQVSSAVICASQNALLHVSTKNGYAAYVNALGKDEAQSARTAAAMVFEPMRWADKAQGDSLEVVRTNLNLANCVLVPLWSGDTTTTTPFRLLAVTEEDGTVLELDVATEGYVVSGFTARILMTGCFAICAAPLTAQRYFLGSCRGDSRVVALNSANATDLVVLQTLLGLGTVMDAAVVDGSAVAPSAILSEPAAGCINKNSGTGSESTAAMTTIAMDSPFNALLQRVRVDPEPQLPPTVQRAVMDLALCSGWRTAGALCLLRHSIRNHTIRREEVNAVSVFFFDGAALEEGGGVVAKRQGDGEAAGRTSYLLMTGMDFTILFAVRSDSVQQVLGTSFVVEARTLYAAELPWVAALLQVTEKELLIVSSGGKRKLLHLSFADGATTEAGGLRTALLLPTQRALLLLFDNAELYICPLDTMQSAACRARRVMQNVRAVTALLHGGMTGRPAATDTIELLFVMQGDDLLLLDARDCVTVRERFPGFALLPDTALAGCAVPLAKLPDRVRDEPLPSVTHMRVYDHGTQRSATLALLTSSGELMTYYLLVADRYGPTRLLKRVHHFLDLQPERDVVESIAAKKRRLREERATLEQDTRQVRQSSERLVPFHDIAGGHRGLYVCGQHPVFLFYDSHRDELVLSRHQVQGPVRGFAPFRSRNVAAGYVYCCEGSVHFATAQPFGVLFDQGWWLQRVPLAMTPHRVVYSAAAHCCYVVCSTMEPFAPRKAPFDLQLRIVYDEEGNATAKVEEQVPLPPLSPATGLPVPLNERYEVCCVSCRNWSCTDRHVLEPNEKVLAAAMVEVPRDTALDAVPAAPVGPVCALATAFPLGEDVTTRGRLLLLTAHAVDGTLRVLHSEAMKGPVTAVCGMRDGIALAVGGTVRVVRYDWREGQLETLAMLYAGVYVTALASLREYVVYGDLQSSATLARFSAVNHTLTVLGHDVNAFSVVSCEMLYHDRAFGLLVADEKRNLAVLGYTPRLRDGGGASGILDALLTVDGEYRLASGCITRLLRLRSARVPASTAVYVTNTGEVGFIVALSEQTNRTGQWVARRMQSDVPHPAGLPPKMFLGFSQDDAKYAVRAKERLLHAPLMRTLFRLDLRTRKALALAALTQIDRALAVGATLQAEMSLF